MFSVNVHHSLLCIFQRNRPVSITRAPRCKREPVGYLLLVLVMAELPKQTSRGWNRKTISTSHPPGSRPGGVNRRKRTLNPNLHKGVIS